MPFQIVNGNLSVAICQNNVVLLSCHVRLTFYIPKYFNRFLTSFNRSKMVSILAFPFLEPVPQTFQELVASGYSIGFLKHGDSAYNTLKSSRDPVYVKLVKEMEILTGNGLDCLHRALNTKKSNACIGYFVSISYIMARNFSDAEVRSISFSKDSTYSVR